MKNIFIFGANSDLIYEYLKSVKDKNNWFLYTKNIENLKIKINKLEKSKPGNKYLIKKVDFTADFLSLIDEDFKNNTIDKIILAQGVLTDNDLDLKKYNELFSVNVISIIQLLKLSLKYLEIQNYGHIIVFSSIAGDLGRSSNYLYGSTKASISTYVEGLQRLKIKNIYISLLKPGPIKTKMTEKYKKNFLWIKKEKAGDLIYKAIRSKKKVTYIPGYWKFIMIIIKLLPSILIKKL